MPLRTILVTAFEPFGGEAINASWEAVRRIDGWRTGDAVVAARMLPCAYGMCLDEFVAQCRRLDPSAVLLTGQAAGRGAVCVERIARNAASATARDNCGAIGAVATDALEVLRATAPAAGIARAIREAGVAVRVSSNAGDFVCNHLYYGSLRYLAAAAPSLRAVFIHLPATPQQALARARPLPTVEAVLALQAAVRVLSETSRSRPNK